VAVAAVSDADADADIVSSIVKVTTAVAIASEQQ
jgi:hypothetical protein